MSKNRTLLCVDDEQNILNSLKRQLWKDDFTVLTVSSGQEALELFKKNEVDVILSDQRMPHMTGVELMGKIKKIYPDTVRIMLSGQVDMNEVLAAINQGEIFRFLTKPWNPEQLQFILQEAWEFHERGIHSRIANEIFEQTHSAMDHLDEQLRAISNFRAWYYIWRGQNQSIHPENPYGNQP